MKHLISWYIVPYVMAICIAFIAWMVAIYAADGLVPVVCGLIMIGTALFTIPVMIYMDYHTIKELVIFGAQAYQDPQKRSTFYTDIATRASNQLGVPEPLARYIVKRVIKKLNL